MVNVVAVNMVGGSGHLSVGTGGSDPINEATTPFAVLTPKMNNGATTIVNLNGGQTIALDIDGNALASTMIRVEILGYYDQDVAGLDFVDVTPCAVFDTRSNKGATGGFAGERLNGLANTTTYQIAGRSVPVGQGGIVDTGGGTGTCGVPDGASAVLINLEAVNAVREGNFWVSATGTTTTGGVLNFNNVTPKMNNANAVVVPLSTAGQLDLEVNAGTFTATTTRFIWLMAIRMWCWSNRLITGVPQSSHNITRRTQIDPKSYHRFAALRYFGPVGRYAVKIDKRP